MLRRNGPLTGDVEVGVGVRRSTDAVRRSTAVPARVVANGARDHQRAVAADLRARHEAGNQPNVDAVAEPLVGDVRRTGGRLAVETNPRPFQFGGVPRRHDDIRVRCRTNRNTLLVMAALRSRCGHYIFISWFLLLSFFFPRLISAVADWMSAILPDMVWS